MKRNKFFLQSVRGMHDRLPEEMKQLKRMFGIIKEVFEGCGYEPMETPALEHWEILAGKKRYGEGEKLIYKFKDRGGRDVGLRYDFTVPLARVIAGNPGILLPFRRYQIQPVWRGDAPQYGRFREFYQCDADIIGAKGVVGEAELIFMTYEILKKIGIKDFKVRINNRKLLTAICKKANVNEEQEYQVYRALDKVDKIGIDGVREKLEVNKIPIEVCDELVKLLQEVKEVSNLKKIEIGKEGVEEVVKLFQYLKEYAIPRKYFTFDPWLSRGLDYYTGIIFEVYVRKPKIGSVAGGGRFDELIGMFGEENIPAVGVSIGVDRLMVVIKELEIIESLPPVTSILVAIYEEENFYFGIKIANILREVGLNVELYPEVTKLNKQFRYANKKGIPYVIVIGPDEIKSNAVTIKNMKTGKEQKRRLEKLKEWGERIVK
jgi:histidyl-tRNA synthetase